jgi:hypothetical protein
LNSDPHDLCLLTGMSHRYPGVTSV